MKKIWKKIVAENPHLEKWDRRLHTFTLPGLDGVAVYDVSRFFSQEVKSNSLGMRSRAIAFSFFLALFPALLFVFSLVPYVLALYNMSEVDDYIRKLIKDISPSIDVFNFLWAFIKPAIVSVAKKRPSLLTTTFVLTLFLASNGVVAMMGSFDKAYDHYHKRNALMTRLIALKITFFLGFLFIFSMLLLVVGQDLLEWLFKIFLIKDIFTKFIFSFIQYSSIILLFFFSISLIYYYGPATKKKYRFISTGATVATILSILTSLGFSYYVRHFAKFSSLYGPIGTIMIMMIWLNLNAFVLLVGYEINAAIYYHHTIRQNKASASLTENS